MSYCRQDKIIYKSCTNEYPHKRKHITRFNCIIYSTEQYFLGLHLHLNKTTEHKSKSTSSCKSWKSTQVTKVKSSHNYCRTKRLPTRSEFELADIVVIVVAA